MRPLVRAAIAAATIVVISRLAEHAAPPHEVSVASGTAVNGSAAVKIKAPCPMGSLPDDRACIPVPVPRNDLTAQRATASARERPSLPGHEHIPRRPDRPEDYARYRLPVSLRSPPAATPWAESDGVLLAAEPGAPVRGVRLEQQQGEAEVVFIGELSGMAVVTRHAVLEASAAREYLVIVSRLERISEGVKVGQRVAPGAPLGAAGELNEGRVELRVRRLREASGAAPLSAAELSSAARSVPVDPRNVLELIVPRAHSTSL